MIKLDTHLSILVLLIYLDKEAYMQSCLSKLAVGFGVPYSLLIAFIGYIAVNIKKNYQIEFKFQNFSFQIKTNRLEFNKLFFFNFNQYKDAKRITKEVSFIFFGLAFNASLYNISNL